MSEAKEITVVEARKLLDEKKADFVDVRDSMSYEAARIPGAAHLNDANVEEFVANADKSRTVVVYCFHGNTSQGGAAYLADQGFREVYSLEGGFELWRQTEKIES